MTQVEHLTAREIHRRLGHPVIDADGHFLELMPLVEDDILAHLEDTGGSELRDRYRAHSLRYLDTVSFEADRRSPKVVERWRAMPSWWGNPVADSHDRATAHVPRLLYERLDEFGIDYMLAYPSWSLGMLVARDDELRAPVLRALNRYTSRLFGQYADRLSSAALIPMNTPEEAIGELVTPCKSSASSRPSRRARDPQVSPTTRAIRLTGWTRSASTAITTTTRSGRRASSWGSPRDP